VRLVPIAAPVIASPPSQGRSEQSRREIRTQNVELQQLSASSEQIVLAPREAICRVRLKIRSCVLSEFTGLAGTSAFDNWTLSELLSAT
jgi:hypothetical protein